MMDVSEKKVTSKYNNQDNVVSMNKLNCQCLSLNLQKKKKLNK